LKGYFCPLFTAKKYDGSTLSSCAASCSTLRITSSYSCNIYYLENGICTAGALQNVESYLKAAPDGSSSSLVAVNIVDTSLSASYGEIVKPGCSL